MKERQQAQESLEAKKADLKTIVSSCQYRLLYPGTHWVSFVGSPKGRDGDTEG